MGERRNAMHRMRTVRSGRVLHDAAREPPELVVDPERKLSVCRFEPELGSLGALKTGVAEYQSVEQRPRLSVDRGRVALPARPVLGETRVLAVALRAQTRRRVAKSMWHLC
jgi:hypothetical protein